MEPATLPNCGKTVKLENLIATKRCSRCTTIHEQSNFNKSKSTKDGLHSWCKPCRKETNELNKEKKKEYNQKYWENNRETLRVQNETYRESNVQTIQAQRKEYRARREVKTHIQEKNREYLPKRKLDIQHRRRTDIHFRISECLRAHLHRALKSTSGHSRVLGCSPEQLHCWLEYQFEPEMTWANYGTRWHIDHILPISKFDFTRASDVKICFSWTNLQPLWAGENREKFGTIIPHYFWNSIISSHRFIQRYNIDKAEYQRVRESVSWLRANS